MQQPTNPCSTCGSVLFYQDGQDLRCAKHERTGDLIGKQFVVAKSAEQAAKRFMDELDAYPASGREAAEKVLASFTDEDLMTQKQFDSAIEAARKAATEGETVVTKAEIDAAVSKAIGSRLNLKPFTSQHASVAAVKGMTVPAAEQTVPASSRDAYGRVAKRGEDDDTEAVRDMHGRRREP